MRIVFLFTLLFLSKLILANPILIGDWNGYIVQNYAQPDNATYLPCTINISSATDNKLAGTIEIRFTHQNGKTYTSKSNVTGSYDNKTYSINIVAESYIYQDILPEKMKWCLGIFQGGIYRSKSLKQYLFKGMYQTKCSTDASLLIVYKK
ncbi:MAG: hypothetical protein IPK18_07735 [Sphingobacteriales bacterium]|nr:MAG: hypothetical protein IPK18_07735 [Sphingobacteriales bacterium]